MGAEVDLAGAYREHLPTITFATGESSEIHFLWPEGDWRISSSSSSKEVRRLSIHFMDPSPTRSPSRSLVLTIIAAADPSEIKEERFESHLHQGSIPEPQNRAMPGPGNTSDELRLLAGEKNDPSRKKPSPTGGLAPGETHLGYDLCKVEILSTASPSRPLLPALPPQAKPIC